MDVQNIINQIERLVVFNVPNSGWPEDMFRNNIFQYMLELVQSNEFFEVHEDHDPKVLFIKKITELLIELGDTGELMLNRNQKSIVSKCIDCIVSLGLTPCLDPSLLKLFTVFQSIDNTVLYLKYKELKFIINSFLDLIKEPTLKTLIMIKHSNMFLAGLCLLTLLPIGMPKNEIPLTSSMNMSMSNEYEYHYARLKNEQDEFKKNLNELISTNQDSLKIIFGEMMNIVQHENSPLHVSDNRFVNIFSDIMLQPNGIQTILKVECDLNNETCQNFLLHRLATWSNFIHGYYLKSKIVYTNHIIPQIWKLLRSNSEFHKFKFQSVALYCMYLMSMTSKKNFFKFYVKPVKLSLKRCMYVSKENVSQLIEDLHTLYYSFKNQIWSFNPKLLAHDAAAIYNMYLSTASSIYYLKSKLEDLVFLILIHYSGSKWHFEHIVFSQYIIAVKFMDDSADIQVMYVERNHQLDLESHAKLVLDLIDKRKNVELMKTMVITLLDMYTDNSSHKYSIFELIFIVMSIEHLIQKEDVKKSFSTNPGLILNLIELILKEMKEKDVIDAQVLSVVITVLNHVFRYMDPTCIKKFDHLKDYFSNISNKIVQDEAGRPEFLSPLEEQINWFLKTIKRVEVVSAEFSHVEYDRPNILLSYRTHYLIKFKNLIEARDKDAIMIAQQMIIAIQRDLRSTNSYVYLNAIFTLAAFCTYFAKEILPILCTEYSMPEHYDHSTETRLKIGKVLMINVKSLDETLLPLYKKGLLNAFLDGVNDEDSLVRVSSIYNLTDFCRYLRYNIGSFVTGIVNCADNVLRHDPAIECRTASFFLLHNIIQEADPKLIESLAASTIENYNKAKFDYLLSE